MVRKAIQATREIQAILEIKAIRELRRNSKSKMTIGSFPMTMENRGHN